MPAPFWGRSKETEILSGIMIPPTTTGPVPWRLIHREQIKQRFCLFCITVVRLHWMAVKESQDKKRQPLRVQCLNENSMNYIFPVIARNVATKQFLGKNGIALFFTPTYIFSSVMPQFETILSISAARIFSTITWFVLRKKWEYQRSQIVWPCGPYGLIFFGNRSYRRPYVHWRA